MVENHLRPVEKGSATFECAFVASKSAPRCTDTPAVVLS